MSPLFCVINTTVEMALHKVLNLEKKNQGEVEKGKKKSGRGGVTLSKI